MTSHTEAIARNSLAGWALLDMDRMVERWAPDVVWDMSCYRPAWPGPPEYVGVAAILAFLAEWLAAFRDGEVARITNYSDPDEARAAVAG